LPTHERDALLIEDVQRIIGGEMTTSAVQVPLDEVLKALASSHRLAILGMLSECTPVAEKACCAADEVCGCKISDRLGLSAPTVSHHMSVLRKAGLVDERKEGSWTYYTLRRDALEQAAAELRRF
jgi:ArsR family transcriptional regulator